MSFAKVALPIPLYPCDKALDYIVPDILFDDLAIGQLVEVPFRSKSSWGIVVSMHAESEIDSKKLKAIKSITFKEPVFDTQKMHFLNFLSRHYVHPLGEVFECALPGPIREASEKILRKEIRSESDSQSPIILSSTHTLNEEQAHIVEGIKKSAPGTHLLWGITGSGKTEVYLNLIENCIRAGKNALVLVPEISLTPQLTSRFEERFPGMLGIFHSSQKATALRRAWLETFWGEKRIAIGARSALFAPLKNLGLIVVDEEHDTSYKQEDRLRYQARDAAVVLASLEKIPIVLGSATPSIETMEGVKKGRTQVWKLNKRASGTATLPRIDVFDLKKQIAVKNHDPEELEMGLAKNHTLDMHNDPGRLSFFFSPELRSALSETLNQGKQSILFLNRRGLGSHLCCPECGHSPTCPGCDVTLTPHKNNLLCHYCGFETKMRESCQNCKQNDRPLLEVGIGTESVEQELRALYPKIRTLRLDRDTVTSALEFEKTLSLFKNKQADVLIGTQMVAKGHDFPDVTLVGILLADLGLNMPDFRALERSFQLLLQVSGRAGRAGHPGRVIVQSFQPEHPVLEALRHYSGLDDYAHFIDNESTKRKIFHYPPESHLALMRFEGLNLENVMLAAKEIGAALNRAAKGHLQILGPVSSPMGKLRSKYRWQILVKATQAHHLQKSLNWIMSGWIENRLERKHNTRLIIDVDPYHML